MLKSSMLILAFNTSMARENREVSFGRQEDLNTKIIISV